MGRRRKLDGVHRVDATRLRIDNPQGVPITLFANDDIPVDAGAVEELPHAIPVPRHARSIRTRARSAAWGATKETVLSGLQSPAAGRASGGSPARQ